MESDSYVIGIDVGGTNIRIGAVGSDHSISISETVSYTHLDAHDFQWQLSAFADEHQRDIMSADIISYNRCEHKFTNPSAPAKIMSGYCPRLPHLPFKQHITNETFLL